MKKVRQNFGCCCCLLLLLLAAAGAAGDNIDARNCSESHKAGKLRLDCSNRGFDRVPANLPRNVSYLNLKENQLTNLAGLENLGELLELDLSANRISNWTSTWLSNCSKLSSLKLSQNNLAKPPTLCRAVPSVKSLWLGGNSIATPFDSSYSSCSQLSKLELTDAGFVELNNETFAKLAGCPIKSLAVGGAHLTSVKPDSLKMMASTLESLDLGQVKAINETILRLLLKESGFQHLKSLLLHGTQVAAIKDDTFASCSAAGTIETLLLDSTPMSELTPRSLPLPRLTELSLRSTRLTGWHAEALGSLVKLQKLDLRSTAVATVGGRNGSVNSLPQLTGSLKVLRLAGANISCDCDLLWLSEKLKDPAIRNKVFEPQKTFCAQPQALKGTQLVKFQPEGCEQPTTAPSVDEPLQLRLIIIIVVAAVFSVILVVVVSAVLVARHRRSGAPRLVLDDDTDPLMASGQRGSIWIRLRRLFHSRSSRPPRPPIFVGAPEDYLSENA